jgi:hypothetical protein
LTPFEGIGVDIALIRQAVAADRVRVTDHADEEMATDGLKLYDVGFSVQNGEVIEDYPTDHPLPSCLIFGKTDTGDPVHSVWAYNEMGARAILVTVYRPDPERWVNWRVRQR